MFESAAEEPRRYRLDISDAARAEAEQTYLWIGSHSPERAHRWYVGLFAAFDKLLVFPYRNEAVSNQKDVRRMLYGKYRVLYRVIEPDEGKEEGMVRILRVVHGATQPESEE